MGKKKASAPIEAIRNWMRLNVIVENVADLQRSGKKIQRQDFYAFETPRADRPLSSERIAIIAEAIGVEFTAAHDDYVKRGGRVAKKTRAPRTVAA